MHRFVKAILVLVALVVIPATAHAQASIVGTVRDSSGAVIPSVTVEASSPALIEKARSECRGSSGQQGPTWDRRQGGQDPRELRRLQPVQLEHD